MPPSSRMLPSVIGRPAGAARGVVRSFLFLCAGVPAIFSAGPFFTFRLGFPFAAFAFLDIKSPLLKLSSTPCEASSAAMNSRRLIVILARTTSVAEQTAYPDGRSGAR
jgi:hypothetical protein